MMKNSEGFKKVSINATNPGGSSFKTLVKDILHGQEMLIEPGLSIFILPDRTIFEFYGIGYCHIRLENGSVIGLFQYNEEMI